MAHAQAVTYASAAEALAPIQQLVGSGHEKEALSQLDALAAHTPPSAAVQRMRGLAQYDLGNLREADAAYAAALKLDPHDGEAAQMRGLTLFRLGRPADALPLLEASHGVGAQSKADPYYVLGLCYMDTRRYDDARHAFAAQFGFPPDSAQAYLLGARMLLRREYLPVSKQFAEHALVLDPHLPLAHGLLGELALAQKQTDEAITQFEAEQKANPLEGSTYERLGDAYSRAARYPAAQSALQQAILLQPNATGPYILLGKVMIKQGDTVGATGFLQRAESMDPKNYMTHSLLAQAYRTLGRSEDAARERDLTVQLQAQDAPKLSSPQ